MHIPRKASEKARIEIIPMIDVIFFLLVFFMVSTLSMTMNRGLPVNLPTAATAQTGMRDNVNLTVLDSDVHFGFTDASGNYSTSYSGFPNTIQVTVRRDASANGSLALFFGRVLGLSSVDIHATIDLARVG